MKNFRVLVFSAAFGSGHVRAAEAVIEAIRGKEPAAEIIHMDFGELISKPVNLAIKSAYIELIKHTPRLWGKFYYRTAKISVDSLFQRWLNKLGRTEFTKFVRRVEPDLIVCTYPTVAGILAQLMINKVLDVPLATVITDYAVHSQWIHPGVDLYIVGCEEVRRGLVVREIDPTKIKVTGIPVSPKFERKLNRNEIAAGLGLKPERLTFLVMGGAYGVLAGAKEVCKIISTAETPAQAIVVCGQDEKLYRSLESVVAEARNPMVRFGFVHNVEELMSASDVIITKAGGLTVSEALTKGLPLIIYKPIPGQEEENAAFLTRADAGRVVTTFEELKDLICRFMEHPEELKRMARAAAGTIPGNAAERAAEHMLELVREKEAQQKIG